MERNTASKALPGLVAIVVALCPIVSLAQQAEMTLEPPKEVRDFLKAWVAGDERVAMSYFSTSDRARMLAPSSVIGGRDLDAKGQDGMLLSGYWRLMNGVWRHQADIKAGFSVVHDQEIIEILRRELGVRVVSHVGDEYLVYIADNRNSIEQFNAHPDAARILLGDGDDQQLTLGVLADLPPGPGLPPPGPFVTFWQQENDKWRIQMIGSLQP